MVKDNTTIPPCTPPQKLYLHGQINDGPYFIAEYDVDCNWSPQPLAGFVRHRNSDTGTELPNCCAHHKSLADQATEWFSVFPDCCDHHKSLSEAGNLKKQQYEFIPEKIVLLAAQTEHVIEESINRLDWEKSITGYIDYCFLSFGLYGVGLNIYLDGVKGFLQNSKEGLGEEKVGKLIAYIDHTWHNYKYDVLSSEFFDYDDRALKRWLDLFPFDMERFKGHRTGALNITIPLPYDSSAKGYSFHSLIYQLNEEALVNYATVKTLELIDELKASKLLTKGLLTDPEKMKIDLAAKEFELSIKKLQATLTDEDKPTYVGIIEQWLSAEKKYLHDIAPIVKKRPDLVPENKVPSDALGMMKKHNEALQAMGISVPDDTYVRDDYTVSDSDTAISPTRSIIEEIFDQMGSKGTFGWKYAFRKKADYEMYVNLLERHFQLQDYELPPQIIPLRTGTKSRMAIALGSIHKELGEKLKGDNAFFDIVRVLSHFQDVDDENLYKDLSRRRD